MCTCNQIPVRRLIYALLAAIWLSSALAHAAPPQEDTWAWVYVGPLPGKWDVLTGKAKVTIMNTSIIAELFHADHKDLGLFRLDGTIKGDRITARTERLHSGSGISQYSGTITTRTLKGFAEFSSLQTIMLSDGWNQIGLTRAVRR
jgi:hypothetical protein